MKNFILLFVIFATAACSTSQEVERNEELMGSWLLQSFEDAATQQNILPPDSSEDIVLILEGLEFQGTTGRNRYEGIYTADTRNLFLLEFAITEQAETEWGQRYVDALNEAYISSDQSYILSYTVEKDVLRIQYSPSGIMVFSRIR